jgi:hypothetical protein
MLNPGYVTISFLVAVLPALVGLIIVAVRGRDRARTIGITIWWIVMLLLHLGEMIILALAIVANRPAVLPQQPGAYGYAQPPTAG